MNNEIHENKNPTINIDFTVLHQWDKNKDTYVFQMHLGNL
jgi:hypothetical protein